MESDLESIATLLFQHGNRRLFKLSCILVRLCAKLLRENIRLPEIIQQLGRRGSMGNEKFLEHVRNPRNVGLLEDANVVIQAGDPECDDKLVFFFRIEDDRVSDIRFLIEGCETTVATSSIVTEMVMGQPLDSLLSISERSIADALDGLPEEKLHCSAIAASAMHAAVQQYRLTAKGEASSAVHAFDHCRIAAQVLNLPLAEVYSSDFDL